MGVKNKIFTRSIFVLICLQAAYSNKHEPKKLELVQVLFRHGERTLIPEEMETFKLNDKSSYEFYGIGEMTNRGKNQVYNIGLMLRQKYKDFLSVNYKASDVYAYSTFAYRTRMSLQLVLAGLYPPTKDFTWNPDIKWQPIPITSLPHELDIILCSYWGKKFYYLYRNETHHISEARAKTEYADIIRLLKEKHGFVYKDPSDLGTIHNILYIDEHLNLTLPDWYDEKMKKRFQKIVSFRLDCMSYTTELKRINAGPILRQFLENMNINDTNDNPRKIYLYSGHDVNVASLHRTLGFKGFDFAGYADAIIFEKWRDANGKLYVKIIFYNGLEKTLRDLKLDECENFCPIDDFLTITRDVIPSDKEMDYVLDDLKGSIVHDYLLYDPEVKTSKVREKFTHGYF